MNLALTILIEGLGYALLPLYRLLGPTRPSSACWKILNVAHGAFYAWGAYLCAFLVGQFSAMGSRTSAR